ncbi:MAG TPA: gluconate 2-dehydrogenase subunit 3 family protein [Saprospiraceae bacterium]|nr:gluconate 2-dehydrogenase subunit 3 family protein [Saprospiraceae bacterium]
MNRRDTLKTLLTASGSLAFLPAWSSNWRKTDLEFDRSVFTPTEQSTIKSIADTIIPKGNSIGALDVGVDVFLMKLFADCYDETVQNNIKVQVKALNDRAEGKYSNVFEKCSQLEREAIFLSFNSEAADEKRFFNLLKSETIRGYSTCEEILGEKLGYVVVPGFWDGCADAQTASK